jgi:sensor histidine kinase YesM
VKRKEIKLNRFLMLFSLSTVSLLLVIIGYFLYVKTERYIDGKTDSMQTMKLNQAAADVRKQFEDIYQTMDSLRNNTIVIQSLDKLQRQQSTAYEKVVLSMKLESSLFNLNKGNELISSISIWTGDGQYSSNSQYSPYYFEGNRFALSIRDNQISFINVNQTYQVLRLNPLDIQDNAVQKLLDTWNSSSYLMCPIAGQGGGTLGILMIYLNVGAFEHILPYGESLAILDNMDQVVFKGSEIPSAMNEWMKAAEYFVRDIGFQGIRIALTQSETGFHKEQLRSLGIYLLIILCGCALLTFTLSQLIGRQIFYPLHRLISWVGRQQTLEERWNPTRDDRVRRRRFTMRDRLFIYFLLTILLPIFLFVTIFYVKSTRIISRELEETFYALFDKTAHRVELFTEQKKTAITRLAYDSYVASYVNQPGDQLQSDMDQLIFDSGFPTLNKDVIGIYDMDNQLIYSNRYKHTAHIDSAFFDQMSTSRRNLFYWLSPAETASSEISLGIGIVDINSSSRPIGYLKTDIDGVFFTDLYSDLQESGSEVFLVDGNGRILSNSDEEKIGAMAELPFKPGQMDSRTFRTGDTIYFSKRIGALPWFLVAQYDVSAIRDQVIRLFSGDIYLLVILFLLILIFSYFMSQYLVAPLASLQNRVLIIDLDCVTQLNLDNTYAIDEVEQLRISFNRMLERIHRLVQDTLDADHEKLTLEFEKKELHLEALQAQINPHFLYNTLENIMYMIEEGERHLAVDMIGLLSRLFRYAMGKDSPLTTLGEEIAYSQSYVKIMNYRYKHRIHCEWQVEAALNDCTVNKMILQPVIENSIRHSLQNKNGPIRIMVKGMRVGDHMELAVQDNGPGIDPATLDEIRLNLERRDRRKVGLYNVNGRIRLQFGVAYGLLIDSQGAGTLVTIRLPIDAASVLEAHSNS